MMRIRCQSTMSVRLASRRLPVCSSDILAWSSQMARREFSLLTTDDFQTIKRKMTIRQFSTPHQHQSTRDGGLQITSVISDPKEVEGPRGVPSRAEQVRHLQNSESTYDILVIGGGATGAGIALDATSRGLRVACIERGDFSSETSSRSTKLIWAGIRYMATASAALLSPKFFTAPISTVQEFFGEMKMVLNCHRERQFMMDQQKHLCNWIPIAIPFDQWHVSPPPFGHKLFGFFPILAPFVLKFYDSMSMFTCPPSYIMSPKQAKEKFPQLTDRTIKYCAVFYEAQHNDARTNIAIAMSAAEKGAVISNYVEMTDVIRDEATGKVVGVQAQDRMTGNFFNIHAQKVVFAGGPFTDGLRTMEQKEGEAVKPAVRGAAGTHIVLPGYYCPSDMGLLDYNTSDGRFLFMLPWEKHTLIGTTDTKGPAETLPNPPEDEVEWLLHECKKYLSPDLKVRRSDVLSAWRGWRPLAVDPHAPPGAPASRDHVISENPETDVMFIAGGKWTTWREMAQEVVDRIVGGNGPKCKTLKIKLFGGDDFHRNIPIELIQKYQMEQDVAEHLARAYGARAWEVCEHARPTGKTWPKFGTPLANGYPYIDAEVVWACREYACTIEDILSRRTRLAFLNKDAAFEAIPQVADIMANELGWTEYVKEQQIAAAQKYVESYKGSKSERVQERLKSSTYRSVHEIFNALDTHQNGFLERDEVQEVAEILGFTLSKQEIAKVFAQMDKLGKGRVDAETFEKWWYEASESPFHKQLSKELSLYISTEKELKEMGGGTFFG